jgi:O-antigen ligase
MAMATYNENMVWQNAPVVPEESLHANSIWQEATAWLVLLPTMFITVSGRIQTDSGPVAFRFTAMEDDSLARRLTRLGCSLLILILLSGHIREVVAVCKRSKLLLSLPLLAFMSTLWSQNPQHTLVDALNLLLTTLFAIYLYLRYPGERLVSFLTFAAFISLLLCVCSVALFPSVGIDAYQQDAWRGIFGQRNNCATACTLFLVVGLHAPARGIVVRLIRASVVFLSVVFVVMSGSRTGWLLTGLALVLTFGLRFINRIRSLDRILFLMVVALPSLLIAFLIGTHFNEVLAVLDKDPTMTQRTVIWAQVIPSILKHPLLGYGYSSFWMGLSGESMQTVLTTGWMEGQAQDGYLDILLQLGLVGLIPLCVLFLRGFKDSVAAVEHGIRDTCAPLAIVLLPLILVGNIGESSLLFPLGVPWFYALTAILTLSFSRRPMEDF